LKLAICQLSPTLGDVRANLAKIDQAVVHAERHDADVALFPELALTGYRLRDLVPHVAVSLERPDPVAARLAEISRTLPLAIGLVEESTEHRFFNSAAYFEDGTLVHVHRKCYLPTYGMFDERMDFSPGERLRCLTSSRFGRVGILVCEDVWHPAASTVLTQAGATMIWALSASPLRGLGAGGEGMLSSDSWRELVRTMARFHTVPVAYVNRAGYEDGVAFAGGSFAVGPGGELLAEARPLEEDILLVDVDPEATRRARAAYPLVRDERPVLIARELERIVRLRAGAGPRR